MHSYFVYILKCSDKSYYTGVTNDYQTRVGQHQEGIDSACYTFKRRPVDLVYLSEFQDINDAIAWEKTVKRWSRKKKEALINGDQESLESFSKNGIVRKISTISSKTHSLVMVSTDEP